MSYEFAGGSLKLKGVSDKKIKKKKKSKISIKEAIVSTVSKPDSGDDENSNTSATGDLYYRKDQFKDKTSSSSGGAKSSTQSQNSILNKKQEEITVNAIIVKKPAKTKAELAYEKMQDKRIEEKIMKRAEKSHKEHVENYNRSLDSLSEYNDIPKVSWTK